MANYFKGTFKNFGFVRLLILSILYGVVSIPLYWILKENAYYDDFYTMAFYLPVSILLILNCASAVNVKNEELDFYDSIRVVGLLGSIVTFIVSLFFIGFNLLTTILAVITVLFSFIQIIVRSKKDLIVNDCGPKSFYKAMYKPGFICLITVGLLLGVLASVCLVDTDIVGKNFYTYVLIYVGYLLVYLVISLFVKKKYFLDDISIILLGLGISLLADNINNFETLESQAVLLALLLGIVELSFRVCLAPDNTDRKYPNYYGYLGENIDLGIPHALGIFAILALGGYSFIKLFNKDLSFSEDAIDCFVIIVASLSAIALISFIVRCKLKNGKEISRTDRALYSLVLMGIIISIYSVYNLYIDEFKFDNISLSNYILYVVGYADLALGILFTCIRIENFNKAEEVVDEYDESLDDEENETLENEEENTSEEAVEETSEEVSEEEVTEDDETIDSPNENLDETDDEFEQFINTLSEKEEKTEDVNAEEANTEETQQVEEASLEEQQAEEVESEDDEEESNDEDEQDEELEESDEEEPTEEAETNPIANVEVKTIETYDSEGKKKVIKKKFTTKMMFAPYEIKQYYSEIKNYLLKYRCKDRATSACESFRYKGLVAKISILGKSLKVYLALDPSEFEGTKYRVKDASDKRRYTEVPCLIKVKSNRSLKYCKELIDLIMERKEVKPKRNFEDVDFTAELIPNGEAILTSIGFASDYISDSVSMKSSFVHDLPDDLENYIPVVQGEPLEEEEIQVTVCLDSLCNHFNDGDAVSLDILKSMGLVATGNTLRIKARGTMDKKLTIYADIFDPLALKMLMCRNCTAVKIER